MARILCISSQTVYGPVGNSAAVPAMQALGHEVLALPTIVLSTHPGHGRPVGQATPAPLITEMLDVLKAHGALAGLDAVMTGYFSTVAQVIAVAKQIETLAKQNQALHLMVDPVIGDHGKLYVAVEVAEAIRDVLLPLATIVTPNLFELTWLSGQTEVAPGVRRLGVQETIVTSIPSDGMLLTKLCFEGQEINHSIARREQVPNGTGDFLAGCYLAHRLLMPAPEAFSAAMAKLERAIEKSAGQKVLVLN
jgi:pyridoxine kinase